MRINFSKSWKGSIRPSKQKKYAARAPLHTRQKFVQTHLSKELRKKYGKRSIGVRKGDKVIVMAGRFRRRNGNVERVDLGKSRVYISGIETTKRDGTKKLLPLHPSNLMVTELSLDDKFRQEKLERK